MRDQAGGGDDGVAPVRKEARKGRPQSVGVHPCSLPGAKTDPGPLWGPKRSTGGAWAGAGRRPSGGQAGQAGQAEDIPTIGLFSCMPPVDP